MAYIGWDGDHALGSVPQWGSSQTQPRRVWTILQPKRMKGVALLDFSTHNRFTLQCASENFPIKKKIKNKKGKEEKRKRQG